MPTTTNPRPHPRVRVALATISGGQITHRTFSSWLSLSRYDTIGPDGDNGCQHVLSGGQIDVLGSMRIAANRTSVIEQFLNLDIYKGVDWLCCIDSDMTFDHDAVCRLLGHAYDGNAAQDPFEPECAVIGALCFAGGLKRSYPTIYEGDTFTAHDGSQVPVPKPVDDYPDDALVKCMGTGAAFLMIHRKVLVHMAAEHPLGFATDAHGFPNPHPWFAEGINKGAEYGEDLVFCMRAAALGYPTYVHTGVKTGHIKPFELNEAVFRQQQRIAKLEAEVAELRRAAVKELVLP